MDISWSSKDGTPIYENGHPWNYASEYLKDNRSLIDVDWENDTLYSKSKTPDSFHKVGAGLDAWLETIGYKREGYYYREVLSI